MKSKKKRKFIFGSGRYTEVNNEAEDRAGGDAWDGSWPEAHSSKTDDTQDPSEAEEIVVEDLWPEEHGSEAEDTQSPSEAVEITVEDLWPEEYGAETEDTPGPAETDEAAVEDLWPEEHVAETEDTQEVRAETDEAAVEDLWPEEHGAETEDTQEVRTETDEAAVEDLWPEEYGNEVEDKQEVRAETDEAAVEDLWPEEHGNEAEDTQEVREETDEAAVEEPYPEDMIETGVMTEPEDMMEQEASEEGTVEEAVEESYPEEMAETEEEPGPEDIYASPEYEPAAEPESLVNPEYAEEMPGEEASTDLMFTGYEELLQAIDIQTHSIRGFEWKLEQENEEVRKLINSIGDEFKLVIRKFYLYTERFNDRELERIKKSFAAAIDEQIDSFTDRLAVVNTELYQRFAGQLDTERDRYEINLREFMTRIREADEQYVKELEQTVNGFVEEDRRAARSFIEEDRKAVGNYLEKDRKIVEGLIESNRAAAENFLAEDRRIVEGYLASDRQAFESYLEKDRKTLESYRENDRRVLESFLESDRKTVEGFLQQERALAGELKRDITAIHEQAVEEQKSLAAKEHDRTQEMFDSFLHEEDVLTNDLTEKLERYGGMAEEHCRTVKTLGDEIKKLSVFMERGFREAFDSYLKELDKNQSKNYENYSKQLGKQYTESINEQNALLEKYREEYQEKLESFVKDMEKEYRFRLEEETQKALSSMEDTVLDLQRIRKADQRNRRIFISGVLFVAVLSSLSMIFSNGIRGIAPIVLSLLVSVGVYMLNTWRDS